VEKIVPMRFRSLKTHSIRSWFVPQVYAFSFVNEPKGLTRGGSRSTSSNCV